MKLVKVFAGTILALSATALQAAPIVTLGDLGELHTEVAGAIEYTFDDFTCPYATCSGDYAILSSNIPGRAARPFGAGSNYISAPYNNIPGTATFGLGFDANYFGLYWGSVDGYNSISFYDDADLIAMYSGSDLVGAFANGNQVSFNSNRFVNFKFGGGELFNKIVMTSTNWAFESDNHAVSSVPEPATALLLLLGLAGIYRARRRRL